MASPFKPSFGTSPPLLVGRDDSIDEFVDGLESGPGHPARATLYTGARGSGKTVLLNEIEDRARQRGWIVVSETATPGILDRLTNSRLPKVLRSLDPEAVSKRLTGITAPGDLGGVTWETLEPHVVKADLREQVEVITDLLVEHETGLLLSIDEIHRDQIHEMRDLVTTVQHAFREERELALVAAGLKSSISSLINDDVLTFLRRADQHHLGSVSLDDVAEALDEPIRASGKEAEEEALRIMVDGTQGYPFMIQLIGHHSWLSAGGTITVKDAERGVQRARKRLGALVHGPALSGVSAIDKSFLLAMSRDEGPSKVADIANRLREGGKYISVYRQRLIDAELIYSPERGLVDFTLPFLRNYLREHAVSEI